MDIVSCFNPPRLVELAGERFWVRSLTLDDHATIAAWLDDVLPGRADRTVPPELTGDEAQAALDSDAGKALLAWVGLRHLGISYEHAAHRMLTAGDLEQTRYLLVLFGRRRTDATPRIADENAVTWWGPNLAALCDRLHKTPDEIGRLTIDQVHCIATEGLPDEKPGRVSVDDVQAMWEAAMAGKVDDAETVD